MNKLGAIIVGILLPILADASASSNYSGSVFQEIWQQVSSDPYTRLPRQKISFKSLLGWGKDHIKKAAKRTLSDQSDLLPPFQKLAHPNGICLKGTWEITEDNPYSGYFKAGSVALIIARASTFMDETTVGNYRGFSMAGKLFPTDDAENPSPLKPANFFVVDDLGGTLARHYTDVGMSNEPAVSANTEVLGHLFYFAKMAADFGLTDKNPNLRQLYPIAELGEADRLLVKTPKWMKIQAQAGQTVDAADFRDELVIGPDGKKLIFLVFVADQVADQVADRQDNKGRRQWLRIGRVVFDASVVSNSCDHRLHFSHPRWKD